MGLAPSHCMRPYHACIYTTLATTHCMQRCESYSLTGCAPDTSIQDTSHAALELTSNSWISRTTGSAPCTDGVGTLQHQLPH
eukprot:m.1277655 g.1277655  ORF g.1277655 m.1277655 type:complete len:82 (-) comp24764_c0_seq34:4773-5018(-)